MGAASTPIEAHRLPAKYLGAALSAVDLFASHTANSLAAKPALGVVVDGDLGEWQSFMTSRTRVLDPFFDVPDQLSYIDIEWFQVEEDEVNFYFAFKLRSAARRKPFIAYGIELGDSRITTLSFGPGADLSVRIELLDGEPLVFVGDVKEPRKLSEGAAAAVNGGVEFRLPKSDLPELKDVKELSVRAYTADNSRGAVIRDRVLPVYLRSRFDMLRSSAGPGAVRVDFFAAPGETAKPFALLHAQLAQGFVPELEAINGIPIWGFGTFPFFYAQKEDKGFSGLNATDRGILSTFGGDSGEIATAQLVGHELAHYQNAGLSKLAPRWLQEGMSEWSSERLLYRHYPLKAVYNYLKRYRVDSYFAAMGASLDTTYLDQWASETPPVGYEKGYMMLVLLDHVVGTAALKKAFQAAINDALDSQGFKKFLEKETGKNLDALFAYWVFPGTVAAEYDPRTLFKDGDGDLLTANDEDLLKTSPTLWDTDGDGLGDGEEYFRGMDPVTSGLDPTGALIGTRSVTLIDRETAHPGALFRLGGERGARFAYSFDTGATAPDVILKGPLLMRPPYSVSARALVDGTYGAAAVLTRPLYLKGNATPVTTSAPTKSLTPFPALAASQALNGAQIGAATFADASHDMPDFLSAYDLTGFTVTSDAAAFTITIKTVTKPDRFGEWGDYVVFFNHLKINDTSIAKTFRHRLSIIEGEAYFQKDTAGGYAKPGSGITVEYGDVLTIRIERSLLSAWIGSGEEQQVCVRTDVTVGGGGQLHDDGECLVTANPIGTIRKSGQAASPFGESVHSLELFTTGMTDARSAELLGLGLKAITTFSQLLGRPLWERNVWRAHTYASTAGSAYALAAYHNGVFFSAADGSANNKAFYDYLFVEQLARLYFDDLVSKETGTPALWVQELFVHWLTMATMYQSNKTADVMTALHLFQINNFRCYAVPSLNCASSFTSAKDQALTKWATPNDGSTGTVKTLMFAAYLDAKLGTAAMSRVLSTFANKIPSEAGLKAMLLTAAPTQASVIDSAWTAWVSGSGSLSSDSTVIGTAFGDTDANGLYKIEEEKLGCATASTVPCNTYPN